MKTISFSGTDNPEGLLGLVNQLPTEFGDDTQYQVVFPSGYLYSCPFPVIAAWSKRVPDGHEISLDVSACQESARRLIRNVGLFDIVEDGLESARTVIRGAANVPLQPIVVGSSTEQVLDRVYHMVDDWAGYQRDISALKTILSELAENILVHSESSSPGYIHARVHHGAHADKCEITFADSGIGVLNSYLEGTNEDAKDRIRSGASALQIATDGLNSSKPKDVSPGGRSYFGYGLFTVKRLIELNRGWLTLISGDEYVALSQHRQDRGSLAQSWQGTIVSLVIDLANPLPLEHVYEEEVGRIVPESVLVAKDEPSTESSAPETPSDTEDQEQPTPSQPAARSTFTVRDIATKLLARETGLAVRAELATMLAIGGIVEVDLDGVEDITPSVADECFGKLAVRLGESRFRTRVQFRGGPPILHRLIDFVVANRLNAQA